MVFCSQAAKKLPDAGKRKRPTSRREWLRIADEVSRNEFIIIVGSWGRERLVSGALGQTASQLGISRFLLGVIVLAIVGNAAGYVAAICFAREDQMGLVMSITVGSSIQVALLIAPLLVIVSHLLGHPMNLVFDNPRELIAIAGVSFAVNAIASDGETTWFEGVLLIAVYLIVGMAFFLMQR